MGAVRLAHKAILDTMSNAATHLMLPPAVRENLGAFLDGLLAVTIAGLPLDRRAARARRARLALPDLDVRNRRDLSGRVA
jgi:hypothetical protein